MTAPNEQLRGSIVLKALRDAGYWADFVPTIGGGLINVEDPGNPGLFVCLRVEKEADSDFFLIRDDAHNYDYLMARKVVV